MKRILVFALMGIIAVSLSVGAGWSLQGIVDILEGLNVHNSVACATLANIALSAEQTLDGVTTVTDRVLVKAQTDAKENGIYVSAAGAWTRATDMDAAGEIANSIVYVSGGTTLGSTGWVCTNDPDSVTLATDDINFAQLSGNGYMTASSGLLVTGNDIAPTGALEDLNTAGVVGGDNNFLASTGAGVIVWESGNTLRTSLGLAIGTDVLAQQDIGITDDDLVEVDGPGAGLPASGEYARWTVNGLEGRAGSEVMGDLSGTAAADFAMNTHKITGVTDPTLAQDAATKNYVDTLIGSYGLILEKGASSFNSTTGVDVAIAPAAGDTNYRCFITPTEDPAGYLGEVWVIKAVDKITVYNSGAAVTTFDYIIFDD